MWVDRPPIDAAGKGRGHGDVEDAAGRREPFARQVARHEVAGGGPHLLEAEPPRHERSGGLPGCRCTHWPTLVPARRRTAPYSGPQPHRDAFVGPPWLPAAVG